MPGIFNQENAQAFQFLQPRTKRLVTARSGHWHIPTLGHFGGLNAEKATTFAGSDAVSQNLICLHNESSRPALFAFSRFIVARDDIAIREQITIGIDHLVDFLPVAAESAFDAIAALTLPSPRSGEL
jgi:hypothetical protein